MTVIRKSNNNKNGSSGVLKQYSPACRVVIVVCLSFLFAGYSPTSTVATTNVTPKRTFPLVIGDTSLQPIKLMEQNFQRIPQNCLSWAADDEFKCFVEWDEWMLANAFVRPGDVVIEFGARYGTTSCILSRAVGPTGAVVSVEPDRSVHGYLLSNQQSHQCGFHALLGTVGPEPMALAFKIGYGSSTLKVSDLPIQYNASGKDVLPNMELEEIEQVIGKKVNVALIDCEGCIGSVHTAGVLDQVDVIILEEDGLSKFSDLALYSKGQSAYSSWYQHLSKDFSCHWTINATNLDKMKHSVWLRKGSDRNYPTCSEYVKKNGLTGRHDFQCLACPAMG